MDQRQFYLRDILTVIFKHLKLIIFLPVIVLVVVVMLSWLWPATYESEAKVRLMRGRETAQSGPFVTENSSTVTMTELSMEDVNSEIEILHSDRLLLAVVKNLGLAEDSSFPYGNALFKLINSSVSGVLDLLGVIERPDKLKRAMEALDERIFADPIRDSHVIEVAVRLGDAEKAKAILDEVLKVYKQEHIAIFADEESEQFFRDQLQRVKDDYEAAQQELVTFQAANNISLLETEKELLLEQYSDARTVLNQLSQIESAAAADNVNTTMISSLASQSESTVVREMQLRLLELLMELNRVSQSLGPNHPTVQSLKEQVKNAQTSLLDAIAETKRITQAQLDIIQLRLDELNTTKAEYDRLEQQVEILSENFELYSQKLEESIVSDELRLRSISNVRILSDATLPVNPIYPNKSLNIVLAIICGILAALALSFFFEYLDHGLKTPEDVEYYLKVAPLASFFNRSGQPLNQREAERLAILVDTTTAAQGSRILQVNSSIPGEGSEQVASALADAYSNDPESRTLLVDFTGGISRATTTRHGLTDLLLDQADFEEVFRSDENLTVIGRGSHAEYPTYLWGSARMQQLVANLRQRYRYIIFHVGPILQSHDAMKLAAYADNVLLVIKADATRREVVARGLETLQESRNKVTGAVLTQRTQKIPNAVYRRI